MFDRIKVQVRRLLRQGNTLQDEPWQKIYELYDGSELWLKHRAMVSDKHAVWTIEQVRDHLILGRDTFAACYKYRLNEDIESGIQAAMNDSQVSPADEILFFIFYRSLGSLLEEFKPGESKHTFGEKPADIELLKRANGHPFSLLMIDLYGALNYIYERGSDEKGGEQFFRELENYIRKIEENLHEKWSNKSNPEKTALLMVLECFIIGMIKSNSKINVDVKSPRLPFNIHDNVFIRLDMVKDKPTIWESGTIFLRSLAEYNDKLLEITPSEGVSLNNWSYGTYSVKFEVKLSKETNIPSLDFLLVLQQQDSENRITQSTMLDLDRITIEMAPEACKSWQDSELSKSSNPLGFWLEGLFQSIASPPPGIRHVLLVERNASIGDIEKGVNDKDTKYTTKDDLGRKIGFITSKLKEKDPDMEIYHHVVSEIHKMYNRDISDKNVVLIENYTTASEAIARQEILNNLGVRVYLLDLSDFLRKFFVNVIIDEEAHEYLRDSLTGVLGPESLNLICDVLVGKLRGSKVLYITLEDIEKSLNSVQPMIEDILDFEAVSADTQQLRVLKALSDAVGRSSDKIRAVPLSSIVEKCYDLSPDEIINKLKQLVVANWCIEEDGFLYRFPNVAHYNKITGPSGIIIGSQEQKENSTG